MKFGHLGEDLSAYLDGEIEQPERYRVANHLGGCETCRAELSSLQEVRARLRSLPLIDLPASLQPATGVTPLRRKPRLVWGAAAAMVAALVAVANLSAPRPEISVAPGDFVATYSARRSLDPSSAGRLIPTDVLLMQSSGEEG